MNYDLDLEKAVLGAILLEKDAIYQVIGILKPDIFYNNNHNIIYNSILKINASDRKIDILTVTNELRFSKQLDQIGGAYYLGNLIQSIGSAAHIEDHCKRIYDLYLKRSTIDIMRAKIKELDEGLDNDIFEVYNSISAELSNLFELSLSSDYHNIIDVIDERLTEISKISEQDKNLIGINTGFSKLNTFTNGFQGSDYVIIGARPSMGKTIIALIIAMAAIFKSGKNVLFFSLEMSKKRIADRLISIITDIDTKRIASNRLSSEEWKIINDKISNYIDKKFIIIDSSNLSIEEIKARAITLHRKIGIDEVIIDYIHPVN